MKTKVTSAAALYLFLSKMTPLGRLNEQTGYQILSGLVDTVANPKRHSGDASVLKAAATVLYHQQPVQVPFCKQQGDDAVQEATTLTQWLHKACSRQTGAFVEQIATQTPQQLLQQKQPGPPLPGRGHLGGVYP